LSAGSKHHSPRPNHELTLYNAGFIVTCRLFSGKIRPMSDTSFNTLEDKVDELIQLCNKMNKENQLLRDDKHNWENERHSLVEKNQLARTRLEKVLQRLKTLEQA
jgi:cell division protein ZapB